MTSVYRFLTHVLQPLYSTSHTKPEWSFLKANNLAEAQVLLRILQCLPCTVYKALLGLVPATLSSPAL